MWRRLFTKRKELIDILEFFLAVGFIIGVVTTLYFLADERDLATLPGVLVEIGIYLGVLTAIVVAIWILRYVFPFAFAGRLMCGLGELTWRYTKKVSRMGHEALYLRFGNKVWVGYVGAAFLLLSAAIGYLIWNGWGWEDLYAIFGALSGVFFMIRAIITKGTLGDEDRDERGEGETS